VTRLILAALVASLASCDDAAPPLRPEPVNTAPAPAERLTPAASGEEIAPWTIRFIRRCSVWGPKYLIHQRDTIVACDGHVFDAETAALREIREIADHESEAFYAAQEDRTDAAGVTTLATRPDGATLISGVRGTELRIHEGTRMRVEPLLPFESERGLFIGERIVALTQSGDTVWLERGGPPLPPVPVPAAPAGYHALEAVLSRPDADEDSERAPWPSFVRDGSSYPRGLSDIAAFEGDAHLTVSRSDAAELSLAPDDLTWARFAMERHLDQGEQRSARTWRDEAGHRVARGHVYIGGCERAHIEVAVREIPGGIEIWSATAGARRDAANALGPVPATARPVPGVGGDHYQGDPSIGAVR
jgi:hypothetical protein